MYRGWRKREKEREGEGRAAETPARQYNGCLET